MCDSSVLSSSYNQTHFDGISEVCHLWKGTAIRDFQDSSSSSSPHKMELEEDVKRLQLQLQEEMKIRSVLEFAIEKNAFSLPSASCLPSHGQELLSSISALEGTVSNLEKQIIFLNCQLSQERNERRMTELNLKFMNDSDAVEEKPSSSKCPNVCDSELNSSISLDKERLDSHAKATSTENKSNDHRNAKCERESHEGVVKLPRMITKGLLDHPNTLSEEMVRCMKNIFMSLADSALQAKSTVVEHQSSGVSPRGHFSSSSWWSSSERSAITSWGHSPQLDLKNNPEVLATENVYDPYRVRGKLSWADIGNYSLATEVSWMSVGKKQLEYASGALRKFRILVELLAKVNPKHLCNDERLAFWINLYNALIMHAYLAYGVPRSDLKLFSLMQKAAYTVGGHSFSAAAIEYIILKTKPPSHRPQIALLLALRKMKITEEQRTFAVEKYEPSLPFALSCGLHSSPAVRIYTARNVKEELEDAQHDFIRASVGVSNKGKLLLPKLVHSFAKSCVDDSNIVSWISSHLPPSQAAFVESCALHRHQAGASSRNCGIIPFDSRFRYLFLPEQPPPKE